MAYVSGTASSLGDLLTAIRNACTANGWTLSGNVLHKGTCYVEVMISGLFITVRGGTGIDGGNALTGATDQGTAQLGIVGAAISFAFPMTYFAHIFPSPDEVYFIVNYNVNYYQTIAFGQSEMTGLTGSGNWYCGPTVNGSTYLGFNSPGDGEFAAYNDYPAFSVFCRTYQRDLDIHTHGVDHQLDSATWRDNGCTNDWASLYWRQPNQWNSESILIPIRVYAPRLSGFISPVLECAHARQVNIANLSDGQIITLGTDKWKIYPWWSRGPYNTRGQANSGLGGHAFRYDGP